MNTPIIEKSEYAQAKHNAGISDTQAKRWQKLAERGVVNVKGVSMGDFRP